MGPVCIKLPKPPHFHGLKKILITVFDQREKLAVFIDGPAVFSAARALEFEIDYKKLQAYFKKQGYLLRIHYYSAVPEDDEHLSIRPLLDFLDYNGFRVVTKPARVFTDQEGRRKFKGSMSVEICVDAFDMAETADHLVLFSGDGDYTSLVAALQRRGRKVSVVSTLKSRPPMISDDLRKTADYFIDLDNLADALGRDFD